MFLGKFKWLHLKEETMSFFVLLDDGFSGGLARNTIFVSVRLRLACVLSVGRTLGATCNAVFFIIQTNPAINYVATESLRAV